MEDQHLTLTLAAATRSRPIAEDAIERLGLSTTPDVFLERLQAEPIENTQFIELSYTDPDPVRASEWPTRWETYSLNGFPRQMRAAAA
jgi:capsular polysaccharide biosynthesis protein